jgi:DNA-binding NarL/FixJ family response regulator
MPIRVLLVDDHNVFRQLMAGLLKRCPEIELIAEAGEGLSALALAGELVPDVLVVDLELPGMSGDGVAARLQASGSPVRTLLMSAHTDRLYIQALLECSAASYLVKDDAPVFLVETIRRIAGGETGWFGGPWGRTGGGPWGPTPGEGSRVPGGTGWIKVG